MKSEWDSSSQKSLWKENSIVMEMTKRGAVFNIFPTLNFETRHGGDLGIIGDSKSMPKVLKPCYIGHAPYQGPHKRKEVIQF